MTQTQHCRTRIKICGVTRAEDLDAVVQAGADAVGFVFYPGSPRYVKPQDAADMLAVLPPFVTSVGLFVNAGVEQLASVVAEAPVSLLQFHGDESPQQCRVAAEAVNRPYLRAVRVGAGISGADLLECDRRYRVSGLFAGLLLDAFVEGYGGGGKVFDWDLIPEELASRVVLSGGLSAQNVTEALMRVRPYAVDVNSGVESGKGIKDAAKIRAFIGAVRAADGSNR